MKTFLLSCLLIFAWAFSSPAFAAAITFDWNGNGTSWTSSSSWNETGGSGDYPGSSSSRTNDIVRFGVTGFSYINNPTLTISVGSSITIASIEFGGTIQQAGTQLTVNGGTLNVTNITQDINNLSKLFTVFNYFFGTGTISCTNINVGTTTATNGANNFLLSDVATLNVSGNVLITDNDKYLNGSGFRLENGNMYLSGQILFANTSASGLANNSAYFTINTVTQFNGSTTTPHLYLSNPNAIPNIPSPQASVNFYGDHGGTGDVTYTAVNPIVYTSSTNGFGSGGGTIDTTKANYDNLTIQATGLATVGTGSLGALKIGGNLTTNSATTFSTTGGTNTSVAGNWTNAATITGGTGSTAVSGSVINSGTMNMASGILEVGTDLTNSGNLNAGSGNITVDGNTVTSGNLKMSSGSLTMSGNYTNSGVFTASSGAVNFNSTDAQALADNNAPGGAGTTFNTVNFTGGGLKTMSGTGGFGVAGIGVLTMAAGNQLATGGVLTLYSTSTSTATVANIPSNSSITGTVNAQRYISGGSNIYRGYRLLSSPVYTATTGSGSTAAYYYSLSYLTGFAYITGTTGTTGGLSKVGNPSMYLYRDNVTFTDAAFNTGNFRGVNRINNTPAYDISCDFETTAAPGIGTMVNGSVAFPLHVGTGVLFFYRGNITSNYPSKYLTNTSAESQVFQQTGTLNQQDVKVINWYTGLSTLQCTSPSSTGNASTYFGYNLVGNPYFSSIDWETYSNGSGTGITAPNVGPSIYILNETTKNYAVYNQVTHTGSNGASRIIPSGQGFYVQALTTAATLTFHESAKTNAQVTGPTQPLGSTLLLSTAPVPTNNNQLLRMQLAADSVNIDETIINFSSTASNAYSVNEDSQYFVGSGIVGFSTTSADHFACAINSMPLPKQSVTVNLNTNVTLTGQYKLSMTQIQSVPKLFDIWLMDKYKGDSLDMRHNATYTFDATLSDTNSYGKNRFALVIRVNPALGVHLLAFNAAKAQNTAQLTWKTENEANYTNFTVERSSDNGKTFDVVGGYLSTDNSTYALLDKNPPIALDKYRLKMEDLNGNVTYSNIQALSFSNTNGLASSNISVYPNPAVSTINLSIVPNTFISGNATGSFNIAITNNIGTIVKTANSTQTLWQDNVSNLLPGTYIIQVVNNNDKSVVGKSKFVKL